MKIVKVTTTQDRNCFVLMSRHSIVVAVHEYNKAVPPDAKATEKELVVAIDPNKGIFGLKIQPGPHSDAPVRALQGLGLSQAIVSSTIEVEIEAHKGDRFSIDFGFIAHKLEYSATLSITKAQILEHMNILKTESAFHPFILSKSDNLQISLKLGPVGNRFTNKRNGKEDTWEFKGNTLCGKLSDSNENPKKKRPPTFIIELANVQIKNASGDMWQVPIWESKQFEHISYLSDRIASVLRRR